jgi:hypothetical protein
MASLKLCIQNAGLGSLRSGVRCEIVCFPPPPYGTMHFPKREPKRSRNGRPYRSLIPEPISSVYFCPILNGVSESVVLCNAALWQAQSAYGAESPEWWAAEQIYGALEELEVGSRT